MKPKILIMDDDASICRICTLLLNLLNYEVDSVSNGEQAVELYSQAMKTKTPYLAVILDLNVKTGMGGLETVKKLRAIDPDLYAIMASGSSVDNAITSYQTHGFNASLPKPFRLRDVTQCMEKIKLPGTRPSLPKEP